MFIVSTSKETSSSLPFSSMALVAGNAVGAGVLALPETSLPSGFLPSTSALVVVWLGCVATALLVAEVMINSEGGQEPSIYSVAEETLGPFGGVVACGTFVLLNYSLLVAYFAKGGEILTEACTVLFSAITAPDLFVAAAASASSPGSPATSPPVEAATATAALPGLFAEYAASSPLLTSLLQSSLAPLFTVQAALTFGYAVGLAGFVLGGTEKQRNAVQATFLVSLLLTFGALLTALLPGVDLSLLRRADLGALPKALPVFVCALVFHNVVPLVVSQQQGDRTKVSQSLILGSLLPLFMYILFNAAFLGAIDLPTPPPLPSLPSSAELVAAAGSAGALSGAANAEVSSAVEAAAPLAAPPFSVSARITSVLASQAAAVAAGGGSAGGAGGGAGQANAAALVAALGAKLLLPLFAMSAVSSSLLGTAVSQMDEFSALALQRRAPSGSAPSAVAGAAAMYLASLEGKTLTWPTPSSSPSYRFGGPTATVLVPLLVFVPPLAIAVSFPDIFNIALEFGGTYGDLVLFGLIPVAMAWRQRTAKSEEFPSSPLATAPSTTTTGAPAPRGAQGGGDQAAAASAYYRRVAAASMGADGASFDFNDGGAFEEGAKEGNLAMAPPPSYAAASLGLVGAAAASFPSSSLQSGMPQGWSRSRAANFKNDEKPYVPEQEQETEDEAFACAFATAAESSELVPGGQGSLVVLALASTALIASYSASLVGGP